MANLELTQAGLASRVREQSTWFELNQNALRHNVAEVKKRMLPSASILSVVKANAYGHGLLEIAGCLREDVAYFGVGTIDEALALRHAGIEAPVLLFGVPPKTAIEEAIRAEVAIAVSSVEQARDVASSARQIKKPAMVHVKVDTGMGRLGIPLRDALDSLRAITALEGLHAEGLFTHFSQGEQEGDVFTEQQVAGFYRLIEQASKRGMDFAYRHAANSVGVANYREGHFNLVRCGLLLYGLYPSPLLKSKMDLRPVLSWRARIVLLKQLKAGESTGYGRTFIASEDTLIGIVPVGYGHGYPFALSNKSHVLMRGRRFPVVGRVSMDYIAVNFGPHFSDVRIGDAITLLGQDGAEQVTGEALAELAGTIPYEIVTQLNSSITRVVTEPSLT